jgi:hypothetical protein
MRTGIGVALVMAAGAIVAASQSPVPVARAIPLGTMFNVLLQTPLDSAKAKADQRFNTGALEDWKIQGHVVVEAGATVRGFVSSVRIASQPVSGRDAIGFGQLTLSFDEVVIGDKPMRMRASVVGVLDPKRQPDDLRRDTTANVVGGEGSFGLPAYAPVSVVRGNIGATGGGDVKLPVGVVLRIRLDQALEFPAAINARSPKSLDR